MQAYSDPERETEPASLPDVEVFYMDENDIASVARDNGIDPEDADKVAEETGYSGPGFYFWFCLPGCMPDSEPNGPYATEEEALEAAREE